MEQSSTPDLEQFLQEPLLPPFVPLPQPSGYPNSSLSSWGLGQEARWDDSIRPRHA